MEQAWEDLEGAALSSCMMRISPLLLSGPPRLQSRMHFLASGRQARWHGTVPRKEAFFLKWESCRVSAGERQAWVSSRLYVFIVSAAGKFHLASSCFPIA